MRGADVEGVVTAPGSFYAELTRVDSDRLRIQRGDESLPRVLSAAPLSAPSGPNRAAIIFSAPRAKLKPK